jgi:hypothetical protein
VPEGVIFMKEFEVILREGYLSKPQDPDEVVLCNLSRGLKSAILILLCWWLLLCVVFLLFFVSSCFSEVMPVPIWFECRLSETPIEIVSEGFEGSEIRILFFLPLKVDPIERLSDLRVICRPILSPSLDGGSKKVESPHD